MGAGRAAPGRGWNGAGGGGGERGGRFWDKHGGTALEHTREGAGTRGGALDHAQLRGVQLRSRCGLAESRTSWGHLLQDTRGAGSALEQRLVLSCPSRQPGSWAGPHGDSTVTPWQGWGAVSHSPGTWHGSGLLIIEN